MNFEAQLLELFERAGPQASLLSAGAASKVLVETLAFKDASQFYLNTKTERDFLAGILSLLDKAARSSSSKPALKQALFLDNVLTTYTRKISKNDAKRGRSLVEELRKIEVPLK